MLHLCALLTLLVAGPAPDDEPLGPAVQESSSCARCHSNAPRASAMKDAKGRSVAPWDLWRSTMMANSTRDPLWRAAVSAEIAATPTKQAAIETKCLSCHAPMAHRLGLVDHGTGSLLHTLECKARTGELARDGVSCTICHGMSPEGLGSEESFTAGFRLDDRQRLFGPHATPFAMPMLHHTGFTATQGNHILSSELCGSCHTLETEALDEDGHGEGVRFLEQAPYLEWRNSVFSRNGQSCQSCHLPTNDADGQAIRTRIARNPGGRDFPPTQPREPFGRHLLVGGNTLVLAMFRDHPEELGVQASKAAFQATLDATREQLEHRTATVAIEDVRHSGGTLSFHVAVHNLTGHKLPTGHPTRRAWLRTVIRNAQGDLLFASGATDSQGRIVDALHQPLPSEFAAGPIEPHRNVIRAADEVATYEAVMADAHGSPTHTLLRGAAWFVDDRLLPKGWTIDHPDAERTAPAGLDGDGDFVSGGDRVRYEIALDSAGPVTIQVDLLYQPLSARWAAELFRWNTPEVKAFRGYYEQADRTPETLATAVQDA